MSAGYKIIPVRFNIKKWTHVISAWSATMGENFVADIIGCSPSTLKTWGTWTPKSKFPYPSMTLFINTCNALDMNPADFFELDED